MSLASLAAEVHEQQKWQQFEETWGHLYPKPGDHAGTMVVAHSDYNDQGVSVVHEEFEGVENSPWFYEWMTHFAFESMTGRDRRITRTYVRDGVVKRYQTTQRTKARSTGIWEFRGVLRVRPSGRARFVGKWTKMDLYPGRIPATKPRGPLLELSAAYQGKRKYMKHYVEGDRDYAESNLGSVVRFLDTMNNRRGAKMAKTKEQKAARALQERTGWIYSECLRLVREKSPEDIEKVVAERGVKS